MLHVKKCDEGLKQGQYLYFEKTIKQNKMKELLPLLGDVLLTVSAEALGHN